MQVGFAVRSSVHSEHPKRAFVMKTVDCPMEAVECGYPRSVDPLVVDTEDWYVPFWEHSPQRVAALTYSNTPGRSYPIGSHCSLRLGFAENAMTTVVHSVERNEAVDRYWNGMNAMPREVVHSPRCWSMNAVVWSMDIDAEAGRFEGVDRLKPIAYSVRCTERMVRCVPDNAVHSIAASEGLRCRVPAVWAYHPMTLPMEQAVPGMRTAAARLATTDTVLDVADIDLICDCNLNTTLILVAGGEAEGDSGGWVAPEEVGRISIHFALSAHLPM